MEKFYVTLGYAEQDPRTWTFEDGAVLVLAPGRQSARFIARQIFGRDWIETFSAEEFDRIAHLYPRGVTATITRKDGIYTVRPH